MAIIITKLLTWVASTSAEGVLGIVIKGLVGWFLGGPFDEVKGAADEAITRAQSGFHERFGSEYGTELSTFIERRANRILLFRSTFPRGRRLTVDDLDPRGFDHAQNASREAIQFFLTRFYEYLDESDSRELHRDLATQEASEERHRIEEVVRSVGAQVSGVQRDLGQAIRQKILPEPIRAAIADPDLSELSSLLKAGKAQEALEFATRRTQAIDRALQGTSDPEGLCAEALRTHRQRLMFASASAASWQGDAEAGRAWWRRARDLGSVDPEWFQQAANAAFNVGLVDEFRHIFNKMEPDSEVYRSSAPLLAYLAEDWPRVDELLQDVQGCDLILARVRARLELFDPLDIDAIRMTEQLLDRSEEDQSLSILQISRARLTLELLQSIVEGYTPLDYDRAPLVAKLMRRALVAVEATEPNTLLRAQGLALLGSTAEILRDRALGKQFDDGVQGLDEGVRSRVFFRYDPAPAPDEIDALLAARQLESGQAILLKASHFRATNQPDKLERELRAGLFASLNDRERARVLRLLVQHLDGESRTAEADALIAQTPLREADRWLLRSERLSADEDPADMADEVDAFPLDIDVLERLTLSTLSKLQCTPRQAPSAEVPDQDLRDEAIRWSGRFTEALPCRLARLLRTEALFAAERYEDLLVASSELDPIYDERAAELRALALEGLGRRNEAADVLVDACARFPEAPRLAANASAMLLTEGRAQEAAALLRPRIEGTTSPAILLHYAHALVACEPTSRETASEAFDLLARAYELQPDAGIAMEAWKAGRGAGREGEAGRFFAAMIEGAPRRIVTTESDLDEVYRLVGETGHSFVQVEGGIEALAQALRRDRERTDALSQLSSAHLMAYTDLLALAGRPWEHWTQWTQQFERSPSDGRPLFGTSSVLVDWPSPEFEHARRQSFQEADLFADLTAILTLGVLGPDVARAVLQTIGALRVAAGTLNSLQEEARRIQADILVGGDQHYAEAVELLRRRAEAIVLYSDDLEAAAPDDSTLGAARIDLGVAVAHGGLYVTDLNDVERWSKEALELRATSASLLATLRTEGFVTAEEASQASERSPEHFQGWETATPVSLTDCLVFDEFAFLAWVKVGLADVLGSRAKVGPWAWTHISEGANRQEVLAVAHERLARLIPVLREASGSGVLIEVEPAVNDAGRVRRRDNPAAESGHSIQRLWSEGLNSLRTAQAGGLQLWADDRFYPLLLWRNGLPVISPEASQLRAEFSSWARDRPPLSTIGVLDRLSRSHSLSPHIAQDAAATLFRLGYRPVHPLLLDYALRQYGIPADGAVTAPFQKLVDAVAEIPHYLPDRIDAGRRGGFTRIAASEVAEHFILRAFQAHGLGDRQREILADGFLETLEHIFREASPVPGAPRSDRTALLFWRGLAMEFVTAPVEDAEGSDARSAALRWLGGAASNRTDRRQDIVRLLEDNALDALEALRGDSKEIPNAGVTPLQLGGILASRTLIPLFDSDLLALVNPVLRRAIGTLARIRRGGCTDTIYVVEVGGKRLSLTVPEEEKERAAAEVLRRALFGDSDFQDMVRGTNLVFQYSTPPPAEWITTGIEPDAKFPVEVQCSLFTLLWADPPDLHGLLPRLITLSVTALDPALALRVVEAESGLVSESEVTRREVAEALTAEILQSGYFELQRDMGHAILRLREFDEQQFVRFLGWLGEEQASRLIDYVKNELAYQDGPVVGPKSHYFARSILSGGPEDIESLVAAVENMVAGLGSDSLEEDSPPSIAVWLANRVHLTEDSEDPFTAAWALSHVLVALSVVEPELQLEFDRRTVAACTWAEEYLDLAVRVVPTQPSNHGSPLEQRMGDRRVLAASALQLATCACSGETRFAAIKDEKDPLSLWLERVWILSCKLQLTYLSLNGGLGAAAVAAARDVQELGLDTLEAKVLDAFDPYAFGPGGEDIGTALTLVAVLKALQQSRRSGGRLVWWTERLQRNVRSLATEPGSRTDDVGNRLGLVAPFRVPVLAQEIVDLEAELEGG